MANANPIIKPEPGAFRKTVFATCGIFGGYRWERARLLVDKAADDLSFSDGTVLLSKAASLLERAMREQRSNRFVGPDSQEGYARKEKQAADLAIIYSALADSHSLEGNHGLSAIFIYKKALAHKTRIDALSRLVGREGNEKTISEVRSMMFERLRAASSICSELVEFTTSGESKNLATAAKWLAQKAKVNLTLAQELMGLGIEHGVEADDLANAALKDLEQARSNTLRCLEAPVNSSRVTQRELYGILSEIHGLKAMALTMLDEPGADEERRKSAQFLKKSH